MKLRLWKSWRGVLTACVEPQGMTTKSHQLEGFIQAGVFLGHTSNAEARCVLENIYLEVFSKPLSEASTAERGSWNLEMPDYSQYDTPIFARKLHDT